MAAHGDERQRECGCATIDEVVREIREQMQHEIGASDSKRFTRIRSYMLRESSIDRISDELRREHGCEVGLGRRTVRWLKRWARFLGGDGDRGPGSWPMAHA
jgi:hypothetical protein